MKPARHFEPESRFRACCCTPERSCSTEAFRRRFTKRPVCCGRPAPPQTRSAFSRFYCTAQQITHRGFPERQSFWRKSEAHRFWSVWTRGGFCWTVRRFLMRIVFSGAALQASGFQAVLLTVFPRRRTRRCVSWCRAYRHTNLTVHRLGVRSQRLPARPRPGPARRTFRHADVVNHTQ